MVCQLREVFLDFYEHYSPADKDRIVRHQNMRRVLEPDGLKNEQRVRVEDAVLALGNWP